MGQKKERDECSWWEVDTSSSTLPALLMAPPYPQLCPLQYKHLDAFWSHRMERKRADISVPSALFVNEGIRNYNLRFAF